MNKILQGDALEQLKTLPDESIDMCITSPPYWGLRDYGTATWEGGDGNCDHETARSKGTDLPGSKQESSGGSRPNMQQCCIKCGADRVDNQLGLEPDFRKFITNLCDIFDEVKRVLKPEGSCWVNLGDTYATSPTGKHTEMKDRDGAFGRLYARNTRGGQDEKPTQDMKDFGNVKMKSLVQIPSRFAIEMVDRGWILRNEIIWHKPSVMPQSATDRFTVDFEKLFFFTKNKKYHFEQQFDKTLSYDNYIRDRETTKLNNTPGRSKMAGLLSNNYEKRNKRSVWTIPHEPFGEAHFAVYPPSLIKTPILAACPEGGGSSRSVFWFRHYRIGSRQAWSEVGRN